MDVNADFEFEALVPKSTDIIGGGGGGGGGVSPPTVKIVKPLAIFPAASPAMTTSTNAQMDSNGYCMI